MAGICWQDIEKKLGYVGERLGCAEGPGYFCRYQGEGPGCLGEGLGYVGEWLGNRVADIVSVNLAYCVLTLLAKVWLHIMVLLYNVFV